MSDQDNAAPQFDPRGADIVEPLELPPYEEELADRAQDRYERTVLGWGVD